MSIHEEKRKRKQGKGSVKLGSIVFICRVEESYSLISKEALEQTTKAKLGDPIPGVIALIIAFFSAEQ